MTRWRGLVKKEWVVNWKGMGLLIAVSTAITLFSVSYAYKGIPEDFSTTVSILIETLAKVHIWYAFIVFINGLKQDMDRSDTWLHSMATAIELISAKIVILLFMVLGSLIICTLLLGGVYYSWGGMLPIATGLAFSVSSIVAILQNSLVLMVGGLAAWVIFHILRSRIGKVAYLVTGMSVIVGIFVWLALLTTDAFYSLNEMGPLFTSITVDYPDLSYRNFIIMGIAPESSFITIGNSVLYAVLSVALFITSTVLFEKKVRL